MIRKQIKEGQKTVGIMLEEKLAVRVRINIVAEGMTRR